MFDAGVLSFVRAQTEHPERKYLLATRGPLYAALTRGDTSERVSAVSQALVEAYQAGYNAAHSGPENAP